MKRATLERRVRKLEATLSGVTKIIIGSACAAEVVKDRVAHAMSVALRTNAHGHLMTAEGHPVRLLCADVRQGRSSSRQNPILGLTLYPMGHELPDQWATTGRAVCRAGRKDLVPYDRDNLQEGFDRFGRDVLKAVGL